MKNKIIFSTNPDFKQEEESTELETLLPKDQLLYIVLERHGGGKMATVIENFVGKRDDLEKLGKLLKTKCGVGGSVKDGYIIIQGDKRENVIAILLKEGYTKVKRKGG